MDLAKNRLAPIREEKAKKELEEKEAIAAATKRRTDAVNRKFFFRISQKAWCDFFMQ